MTVNWDVDGTIEDVRAAAFRGVESAVEAIKARAVGKITAGTATGRIYKRGGIEHQASAPGEPPAGDSGRLIQSIRTPTDKDALTGEVVFSTAYAAALEFGREDESILPRPYARPSLAEEKDNFIAGVRAEVKAAVDR